MGFKLIKARITDVKLWERLETNYCACSTCPAPKIPFSAGDYVVSRRGGQTCPNKHYHPICAESKNIIYN